ncbi:MAG: hypothetical protein Q8L29_01275 [archaeon]|nr:hypothetical protein [archaeon]
MGRDISIIVVEDIADRSKKLGLGALPGRKYDWAVEYECGGTAFHFNLTPAEVSRCEDLESRKISAVYVADVKKPVGVGA